MKVYGHRGAAGEAPENTLAGFLHAVERGARYLELDLGLSADDQLVVIHDRKVNRTTYSRGAVSNYTADELAGLDARRVGPPWPGNKYSGVPTLDEVLAATPEVEGYYLEVKHDSASGIEHMAELLAERFYSPGESQRIVVTSMDQSLFPCLSELAPHIDQGYISVRPDAILELETFDCRHLLLPWGACNAFSVRHAHKLGVEIAAWTVNDPPIIKNLYRMKVDSVITDYPSMALPLVGSLMR